MYHLEESSPITLSHSMSSWAQQGCAARLEFLSKEEMGGGLRRAIKALCTWSEDPRLSPGHFYVIKSFQPDVVDTWRGVYPENTVLHLCLRVRGVWLQLMGTRTTWSGSGCGWNGILLVRIMSHDVDFFFFFYKPAKSESTIQHESVGQIKCLNDLQIVL